MSAARRLIATLVLALASAFALPVLAEPPKGIFVAYGRALNDRILRAPYLAGVLVRTRWNEAEPQEGRYDWSYLRREIALAKQHGKKIALGVAAGPATPDWVYAAGATAYSFSFLNPHSPRGGRQARIPPPWDPVYLDKWRNFVRALGREFGNDPDIVLVHITGSSKNGFEIQLPDDPPRPRSGPPSGPWVQQGYERTRFLRAWESVIDTFAQAFPRQYLDLDMHAILGDTSVPAELADYGYDRLGKRFGTFAGWLSNKPPSWDSDLRKIMQKQCRRSFCNYQLIANETRQPQRLGPGGLKGAIETGRAHGAHYFEVWEADVKNPNLDDMLSNVLK